MGGLLVYLGRAQEGIAWLEKAKRLDPYFGPTWYWFMLGVGYFIARRHSEAIASFERAQTMPFYVHACKAACYAQMGELRQARECATETLRQKPDFSSRVFASKRPFRNPVDFEHLLTGFRKAGLPD
jgi:adenylate cyclase